MGNNFKLKMAKQLGEKVAIDGGFTELPVDPFEIAAPLTLLLAASNMSVIEGGAGPPGNEEREMSTNLNFECSAVIQRGYAIFGVGETDSDAWDDAEQWLDPDDSDCSEGPNYGDLTVVPCTRALMERVMADGGAITWAAPGKDDDGICLPEEMNAEEEAD